MELHVGTETLLIDKLQKTELPGQTLDMIKQHKSGLLTQDVNFTFSLVVTGHEAYRVKFMTHDYETLRQWIVGLNCLITHRSTLTRLSQLIL